MTGKQFLKSIMTSTLSLALILAVSAGTVPAQAAPLDDLRQQQSSLQQQGKQLDDQLQKLKNDKAQQQQYQEALRAKGINLEQQIDSKNQQIWDLDSDIFQKQKTIAAKQKDIDANFEKLKERVCALYLTGEASNLEIVLNAKNIMDLADKTEILRVVSEHDTALINTLKSDLNSVEEQKAAIEQNRKAVGNAKTSLVQNRKQLNALAQEAARTIAALNESQQNVESAQANNKQAQQAADASVSQWLSDYYASQENASQENSAGSGSGTGSNAGTGSNTGSSRSSGGSTGESSDNAAGGSSGGGSDTYSNPGPSSGGSASGMVSLAGRYIGRQYEWGAAGPNTFDCSGFVSYVANRSGWSFGRLTVGGLHGICRPVSNPQRGDLIFYSDYEHVGIYIGGGRAIQCDGDQTHTTPGVETVSLSGYWGNQVESYGRLP